MDLVEYHRCIDIMTKIMSRPIAKLFLGTSDNQYLATSGSNVNLISIMSKLQSGLYESDKQLVTEIRQLFNVTNTSTFNQEIYKAAAQQLYNEFMTLYNNKFPSKEDICSTRLSLLASEFTTYLKENKIETFTYEKREGKTFAAILDTDASKMSDKQLLREIKFLKSPDLIVRVACLIHKLRPDAIVLDSNISLKIDLLSEEQKCEVKQFVHSLLTEVAMGKYDPYKQPIGTY